MLLGGMRPEGVLQLPKKCVIRRDGILAIVISRDFGQSLKTDDSLRTLPIPETLLELGF